MQVFNLEPLTPKRYWPETMSKLTGETNYFINELHAAVDAHLDWVSRVLSYTVLGKSPSDDVLDPLAHTICQFGRWFALNKLNFEKLDAQKTQRLVAVHQKMHEAIRTICTDLLAGRGGESADLDVFDQMQSEFIHLLSEFETQILAFQSEPLPWALTWSEHLSVNIPAIDAEHQHFIQLSNELNEVITHGNSFEDLQKCIQSLVDDAGGHFYHEESMFRERGYPEAEEHTQIHAKVLIELSGIMGNIQENVKSEWIEVGLAVRRILVEHFLTEDMKYRDYYQNNLCLPAC